MILNIDSFGFLVNSQQITLIFIEKRVFSVKCPWVSWKLKASYFDIYHHSLSPSIRLFSQEPLLIHMLLCISLFFQVIQRFGLAYWVKNILFEPPNKPIEPRFKFNFSWLLITPFHLNSPPFKTFLILLKKTLNFVILQNV